MVWDIVFGGDLGPSWPIFKQLDEAKTKKKVQLTLPTYKI